MSGTTKQGADEGSPRLRPPFEAPSNVLLLAPFLDDTAQDACHELTSVGPPEQRTVIYLSFTHARPARLDRLLEGEAPRPSKLVLITPTDRRPAPSDDDRVVIETVSSPGNLTDVGVALSAHLPDRADGPMVACVDSITALLQYVDPRTAYKFLNVLVERFGAAGARAHYHLDPTAHDAQVVHTFSSLFDATLEVGEDGALRPLQQA